MEPIRSLLSALNQLVTTTGVVWWRCLPRLLVTAMLGWLGYRIFAQGAALVVDVSAWWSLLLLSIGFVVRLSAIIIGLRIAGEQLQIRAAIPLPDDDPRDDSMSHLLSITLLPFLGIYAVFDVITDAANHIQIDYYVFSGLTFERQVLSQFNPEGAGVWLIVGVIVGLYVVRRLVEAWFERTGFRPLGLVTAVTEGFFIMIVLLSGRQVLVMVQQWVDDRNFRVWLDYPGWGLQQVFSWVGVDISDVLDQLGSLWFDTVWPGVVAMVVEPMLWLALASLVYGSQVLSAADLWRRGRPVTLGAGRSGVRIGDRERGVALGFSGRVLRRPERQVPTHLSVAAAGAERRCDLLCGLPAVLRRAHHRRGVAEPRVLRTDRRPAGLILVVRRATHRTTGRGDRRTAALGAAGHRLSRLPGAVRGAGG